LITRQAEKKRRRQTSREGGGDSATIRARRGKEEDPTTTLLGYHLIEGAEAQEVTDKRKRARKKYERGKEGVRKKTREAYSP